MASAKPHGVCWCDCHMNVDDKGRRVFGLDWPSLDNPVALATACKECKKDHDVYVQTCLDYHHDRDIVRLLIQRVHKE